jgi:hypothetical protein
MNKKRLNAIRSFVEELQDKIELLKKQFGNTHPIYKEMGGLVRSLRIKTIHLEGVKTDYQGNILVSENRWKRLKKAGHELDEIVENSVHRDEYKKSSDRLWKVINEVEGVKD